MKNPSFDLNVRYLDFDGRKIEIDYISSLCSDELIAYLVEGITNAKGKTLKDCLNNGIYKFILVLWPYLFNWTSNS